MALLPESLAVAVNCKVPPTEEIFPGEGVTVIVPVEATVVQELPPEELLLLLLLPPQLICKVIKNRVKAAKTHPDTFIFENIIFPFLCKFKIS